MSDRINGNVMSEMANSIKIAVGSSSIGAACGQFSVQGGGQPAQGTPGELMSPAKTEADKMPISAMERISFFIG